MIFKYTAINIATAEKKYGSSFFDIFGALGSGKVGVSDLLFLFVAGGHTEEEFERTFKIDDVQNLIVDMMAGISEAGFLGETVRKQTKALIENLRQELAKSSQETSENSGKASKK